jgi:hypothetical protein
MPICAAAALRDIEPRLVQRFKARLASGEKVKQ